MVALSTNEAMTHEELHSAATAQQPKKSADFPAGMPAMTRVRRGTGLVGADVSSEATTPRSQRSPRRGELAKEYESRNSAVHKIWRQNMGVPHPPETPRLTKKAGVRNFTDPMNPFDRSLGLKVPSMDDIRQEADRAGARTRNPGILSADKASGGEGDRRTSPHFYSAPADWRRQKRPAALATAASSFARSSDGFASALIGQDPQSPAPSSNGDFAGASSHHLSAMQRKHSSLLENYLNDMKKVRGSRRFIPATPSAEYQRMMDRRVKLSSEREVSEMQPRSARPFGDDTDLSSPRGSPRGLTRSVSCEPWMRGPGPEENCHGFLRKKQVAGAWANRSSSQDVFRHVDGGEGATPRRFERLERAASARFDATVEHMRSTLPSQRSFFNECRTQGKDGTVAGCLVSPRGGPPTDEGIM
mmetsp:Transcript_25364/g.58982  ORF Transcript_25364/g.58982 Transcript_25364/m.58982 type:complete len:417 (+) Transcript_25364:71-1321(+)